MVGSQPAIGISQNVDRTTPSMLVRNAFEGISLSTGEVTGYSIVHKFGRNPATGTSFVPVSVGGIYQTPQPASATTLRVKAGDVNDDAAGTGARAVMVQGLDETGAIVTEELATNGIAAGAAGSLTFTRLFRAWVSESGTYGTATAGSHADDVTIENGAGGTDWLTIDSTDYPRGQSEVAAYTVPLGKTAYIFSIASSVDSTQTADVLLFKRESILDAAAPYEAMRMQLQYTGLAAPFSIKPLTPLGPYPALTDILFLAKVGVGTGAVEIDFEILLIDD